MVDFLPAPGFLLLEPIEEQTSSLKTELKSNENILSGKVLKLGPAFTTDFNATLDPKDYAKVGDTIYFLSYDQRNYDWFKIQGKKYFIVKVQDVRGVLNG